MILFLNAVFYCIQINPFEKSWYEKSWYKKSLLSWMLAWTIRKKFDSEMSKCTLFTFRTKVVLLGSTQFDLYALNVPAMPVLLKHCDSSLFFSLLCGLYSSWNHVSELQDRRASQKRPSKEREQRTAWWLEEIVL